MAIGIDGKPKPVFVEGQRVSFDLGKVKGFGRIRGRAIENLIDTWIVEVTVASGIDETIYPWSCIVVQHTLLQAI